MPLGRPPVRPRGAARSRRRRSILLPTRKPDLAPSGMAPSWSPCYPPSPKNQVSQHLCSAKSPAKLMVMFPIAKLIVEPLALSNVELGIQHAGRPVTILGHQPAMLQS